MKGLTEEERNNDQIARITPTQKKNIIFQLVHFSPMFFPPFLSSLLNVFRALAVTLALRLAMRCCRRALVPYAMAMLWLTPVLVSSSAAMSRASGGTLAVRQLPVED